MLPSLEYQHLNYYSEAGDDFLVIQLNMSSMPHSSHPHLALGQAYSPIKNHARESYMQILEEHAASI